MDVLVVTAWFPTRLAPGSGLFCLRDAELLAESHRVRVLHLCAPGLLSPGEESEALGGVDVRRVPAHFRSPGTLPGALRALRDEVARADLVHTMALPALAYARLARIDQPLVHTEHLSTLVTPVRGPKRLLLGAMKRLFRRPIEVVAVSRSLAAVIDPQRDRPCTVIANHVMSPTLAPGGTPTPGANEIRLIAVGGLVARKGPLEAVGALAELVRRGIPARLQWVGVGALESEMLALARELGVADRLDLPGHLAPADLSRELSAASLFLLPVETETFGVAIAEALMHGLPVVATGTGGHEEFLPQAGSRLIADRTPEALAAAVLALLEDPAAWSREQIAQYAASRFSDDVRRAQYQGVYVRAFQADSLRP